MHRKSTPPHPSEPMHHCTPTQTPHTAHVERPWRISFSVTEEGEGRKKRGNQIVHAATEIMRVYQKTLGKTEEKQPCLGEGHLRGHQQAKAHNMCTVCLQQPFAAVLSNSEGRRRLTGQTHTGSARDSTFSTRPARNASHQKIMTVNDQRSLNGEYPPRQTRISSQNSKP